jgi:hypothetical protein
VHFEQMYSQQLKLVFSYDAILRSVILRMLFHQKQNNKKFIVFVFLSFENYGQKVRTQCLRFNYNFSVIRTT